MKKYQIICMAYDGEYQRERPEFETIDDAWDYSNDLGPKWIFYPFHFVVSGNRIVDTNDMLERMKRKQIKTIQKTFNYLSKMPEMQGADMEDYMFNLRLLTL